MPTKQHYASWIDVANEFWALGMHDRHALRRHAVTLEAIADHAQAAPSEVDFNESMMAIEFTGKGHADRVVRFEMSRLHGRAAMVVDGEDLHTRPAPKSVALCFAWLNAKKPRAARKAVSEQAVDGSSLA